MPRRCNTRWVQCAGERSGSGSVAGGKPVKGTLSMKDGTDDQKRRESIALFRHALVGDLVHEHQGLYAKLRAKAERDYEIPFSRRRRVAVETLRDWLRAYRRSGFDGLLPKPRSDNGLCRALPSAGS